MLLDIHIFIKNSNRLVRYYLTRVHLLQRFNNLVRYYLTRYFLLKVLTGLSGTAWQKKIPCFYGNQKSITKRVRRNTFPAASRYDRERRRAAVSYCLTRLSLTVSKTTLSGTTWHAYLLLQNFNSLVRYYLTRVFLSHSFNSLVKYCLTRIFLLHSFNRLVKYCLTRIFLLQSFNSLVSYYLTRLSLPVSKTALSSSTWHAYLLLQNFNSLVKYHLTRIFLLKISTGLSGTAWQEFFCHRVL